MNLTIPTFSQTTPVASINQWIVVQQRTDNTISFDQTWSVYRNGFGQITSNFWLGLEKIYQLAKSGQKTMLRLEVLVVDGKWYSTEYSLFYLESEAGKYRLHVNGNWGDMGDVFNLGIPSDRQNGMAFTTKDADHDLFGPGNCASSKGGGFWYNACYHISLNGQYLVSTAGYLNQDNHVSMFSVTRMMIKLVD